MVPDAQLLFSGDYKRSGLDLVLSKDGHDHLVRDYFRGEHRATLASPDGANLSGTTVSALAGQVDYAQAGGAPAPNLVIGHVTKLTGSATAIRNGVSITLNMGDNIHGGDVVQSGSNSSLGMTFIDGTVFGLSSNARMVLNEMIYDPNGASKCLVADPGAGDHSVRGADHGKTRRHEGRNAHRHHGHSRHGGSG